MSLFLPLLRIVVYVLCIVLAIGSHVKRSKKMLRAAIVLLVALPVLTALTFFRARHSLRTAVSARTGREVYEAVFGKPATGCVQVRRYFDPVVPVMDDALYLYFDTCPQEVQRILALQTYTVERKPGSAVTGDDHNWLNPSDFTDTVLYCYHMQNGNTQFMYISTDSSRVFYEDII